jgi:histone H3/H4
MTNQMKDRLGNNHTGQHLAKEAGYCLSDKAMDALKRHTERYSDMLLNRAFQAAKHNQADVTSAADIEIAARELVRARGGRISKLSGVLGGALIGAAASEALSIIPTAQASEVATFVLGGGAAVLGAFLLAFHISKD